MYSFKYGEKLKGKPLRPTEWFLLGSVAGVVFSGAVYLLLLFFK